MQNKNEPPYYLIHKDGQTHEFNDIDKLWRFSRTVAGTVGKSHVVVRPPRNQQDAGLRTTYEWIIRDVYGNVIINEYRRHERYVCGNSWRMKRYSIHKASFSNGLPVPGTGRQKGGHYFSRPSQLNVVRAHNSFLNDLRHDEDMLPWHERGRSDRLHTPPSAWDDGQISSLENRNWKKFRRFRWK